MRHINLLSKKHFTRRKCQTLSTKQYIFFQSPRQDRYNISQPRASIFLTFIYARVFVLSTYPSLYPSRRSEAPRGAWTTLATSSAGDRGTPPYPRRGPVDYRRNSPPVEHLLSNISSPSQPKTPRDPLLVRRERLERSGPGNSPRTCSSGRNPARLDEAPLDCPGRQHRRTGCSLFCADPANRNVSYVGEIS